MNQHTNQKLHLLTLAGVFTALTAVGTLFIQIPTPTKGYINLGDCFVNLSAWILGGAYGAAAAGIGSALADLISGYAIYAPATLIIKALMAVASYQIYHKLSEKSDSFRSRLLAASVAELIMLLGYAVFDLILYHSLATAVFGMGSSVVQGIAGVASSVLVHELLIKKFSFNTK